MIGGGDVDDAPTQRKRLVGASASRAPAHKAGLVLMVVVSFVAAGIVGTVEIRDSVQSAATERLQSAGPMVVGTAKVDKGDMPVALSALGTVTPLAMVTVKTKGNGQVIEVA